jgi:hypothetical protein
MTLPSKHTVTPRWAVRRRGISAAGINATGATYAARTPVIIKAANTNSAACCEKVRHTERWRTNTSERAQTDSWAMQRGMWYWETRIQGIRHRCFVNPIGWVAWTRSEIESAKKRTSGPGALVHAAQKRKCAIPVTTARRSIHPTSF